MSKRYKPGIARKLLIRGIHHNRWKPLERPNDGPEGPGSPKTSVRDAGAKMMLWKAYRELD